MNQSNTKIKLRLMHTNARAKRSNTAHRHANEILQTAITIDEYTIKGSAPANGHTTYVKSIHNRCESAPRLWFVCLAQHLHRMFVRERLLFFLYILMYISIFYSIFKLYKEPRTEPNRNANWMRNHGRCTGLFFVCQFRLLFAFETGVWLIRVERCVSICNFYFQR